MVAKADVLKAEGQIREAKGAHQQALDELETKKELYKRNPGNVAFREIEKLQVRVEGTAGRNRCRHRCNSQPNCGSRPSSRQKRPAPKPRWLRP